MVGGRLGCDNTTRLHQPQIRVGMVFSLYIIVQSFNSIRILGGDELQNFKEKDFPTSKYVPLRKETNFDIFCIQSFNLNL